MAVGTEWTLTKEAGDTVRYTWTDGINPDLSILLVGDIANVYGTPFDTANHGAFFITEVINGPVGIAFFEISNLDGVAEVVTQVDTNDITFLRSIKHTIFSQYRYATIIESQNNVIHVLLPATTQIVERHLIGAAHLHEDALDRDFLGSYIYDPLAQGVLSEVSATLTEAIESGQTYRILNVDGAIGFPDEVGYIMLEYGTSRQEGPIKYIGRPSNNILLIDPTYVFQYIHAINADITLLSSKLPIDISSLGADYAFYLTGTVAGRIYAEALIEQLVATGLTLVITVIYPSDVGLGNAGLGVTGGRISDKVYVWGGDPS